MKTSKIIFISFFGIVGVFLLSLMIQTNPEKINNPKMSQLQEKSALTKISHLVVQGGITVRVRYGEFDSIKCFYPNDLRLEKPCYRVNGDTLLIKISSESGFSAGVLCSQLKSITIDSATVQIYQNKYHKLTIVGTHCEINSWDEVSIDSAIINLKSSKVNFQGLQLGNAQFFLDHTESLLYNTKIDTLKAKIINDSELVTDKKILKIDVESDESSRFYSR